MQIFEDHVTCLPCVCFPSGNVQEQKDDQQPFPSCRLPSLYTSAIEFVVVLHPIIKNNSSDINI